MRQGSKQKALEICEYLLTKNPEREDIRRFVERLKTDLEGRGAFSKIKEAMKKKIW
jgi:hypothetical protein